MSTLPPAQKQVFSALIEEHRAGTRPPLRSGEIAPDFYTDPDQFAREQHLFNRQALVVGHSSLLKKAGDYFVHDHGGQPILVVRGEDEQIRAFLNVCRHRGVRLTDVEGVGNRPSFVCPYHNWVYALDGSLVRVPLQSECFPELDKSCHGLKALPLAVCEGLIFVAGEPDAPLDLDQQLGPLAEDFKAFGLGEHVFFRQSVTRKRANWKLIIEAFLDGYHVVRLHRKTVGPLFLDGVAKSQRMGDNIISVVARQEFPQALDLPESQWNLRHHASCAFFLFPNTTIIIHPDYISYLSLFPQSPDETVAVHGCLIAEEPRDDKAAAHWDRAYSIIEDGVFQAEDLFVSEQAQRGMRSGANDKLLFGNLESAILDFHDILAEKLA